MSGQRAGISVLLHVSVRPAHKCCHIKRNMLMHLADVQIESQGKCPNLLLKHKLKVNVSQRDVTNDVHAV